VKISELMTPDPISCLPAINAAQAAPVEGFGGTVLGIVSINDIVRSAGPWKPCWPSGCS
jgi:CBS domain-containing protein